MWNVSHELEFEHLPLFGKVIEPLGDGALLKEGVGFEILKPGPS